MRLDVCELAYRFVAPKKIFEVTEDRFPGGIALWGAVAPVFDTSGLPPEFGIHVHARAVSGGRKEVDETFDAISIKNDRDLFDESRTVISGETAVNYYISRFLGRDIRSLFCIHCGELHLDAGYFAVKPHRRHLCHGCGQQFGDSAKAVSNPIALLRRIHGLLQTAHATIRPNRNLKITQAEYPGGIQLWASNPAFVWTADREEEEGLHVHTYDAAGQLGLDDTYGEVILDGVLLDEIQIQHFMAQGALPYLKDRVLTLRCPTCRNAHFDRGEFGFLPHAEHLCESCGASFGSPGKLRMVVSNPFVEVREQMLRNRPNVVAAEGHTQ